MISIKRTLRDLSKLHEFLLYFVKFIKVHTSESKIQIDDTEIMILLYAQKNVFFDGRPFYTSWTMNIQANQPILNQFAYTVAIQRKINIHIFIKLS